LRIQSRIKLFSLAQFLTVGFYSFILGSFPIYLSDIGLSSTEIAWVNVLGTVVFMSGGFVVLHIMSEKLTAKKIIYWSSFLSLPIFYLFLSARGVVLVTITWFLFSICTVFTQTLLDVHLLRCNERGEMRYERIRAWGSIILGFVVIRSLISLKIASYIETPPLHDSDLKLGHSVFKLPVILLLISAAALFMSHAPLYVYQSLYLRALGWSSTEISIALNLSVFAEVLFFLNFKRLERFMKLETILILSALCTMLRWLMMGLSTNFYIILLSELLHAFSFGGVFLASIRLAYNYFPEPFKGKSQGILSLFGSGLGSLLGRYGIKEVGTWYTDYSQYNQMFLLGFWVALVGLVSSSFLLKVNKSK
jgi:PPP family 3-phenylpropionic acid transporter